MSAEELLAKHTINDRKARCRRCRSVLMDCEPMAGYAEWWHKAKVGCKNDDKVLGDPEIIIHLDKRDLRARNRGARMASKLRPKKV